MDIIIPKGSYNTKIIDIEIFNPSETDRIGLNTVFEIIKGKFTGCTFETQFMLESENIDTEEGLSNYVDFKLFTKELGLKLKKTIFKTVEFWEDPSMQQQLQSLQDKTHKVFISKEIKNSELAAFIEDFVIIKPSIPWGCIIWTIVIAFLTLCYILGSMT